MIDGKIFFDQPVKKPKKKHRKTLQKLLLLKQMVIQEFVY